MVGMRALWRRGEQGLTISLSSSGNSAMEAGFLNLIDTGDKVISCHWGFFGSRLNDFAHRVGRGGRGAHGRPRSDRAGRPDRGDARRQPGCQDRIGRPRRDLHRRGLPARRARGGDAVERVRGAPVRGLRDIARRSTGRGGGVGARLRVLVLAEIPGLPSRPGAGHDQRSRDRGDEDPQGPGPLLLRLRGARAVLGRATDHVPPHDADPAVLRALHGRPTRARGRARGAMGPQRGRGTLLPGRDQGPRVRAARRSSASARRAHRGEGARRRRRERGSNPVLARVRPGGRRRSRTEGARPSGASD